MLRSSTMALAALWLAAMPALAPTTAAAGARFDYYGGKFLLAVHTYGHEYPAFNPSCAWLRRPVLTPVGPRWQLVPLCF